ncbi:MAG: B12-binding domain-containing radical SAM protein [Planctomycetota bacterium]|jgi:hypothetical protein
MTDVALVSPPASSPFGPTMALVALKSILHAHDISVAAIDANAEALHAVLNPQRVRQAVEPYLDSIDRAVTGQVRDAIEPRRRIEDLNPPPLDRARAEEVLDRLPGLWQPDRFTFSRNDFKNELMVVNDALILASLRMSPYNLTIWGASAGPPHRQANNPFIAYLRDDLAPEILEIAPKLVAMSLSFLDQLFYGLVLMHELRVRGYDGPIVMGGAYITAQGQLVGSDAEARIPQSDPLARTTEFAQFRGLLLCVDPITGKPAPAGGPVLAVRGEGEKPLLTICDRIARRGELFDVPGAIYMDPTGSALVFNEKDQPLDGPDLPPIDLSGLPIGRKYLTPVPVAPLMSSRGCYWNKCAFCGRTARLDSRFRQLDPEIVAVTMASYVEDHGVEFVVFCDEAMTPVMLKRLTDGLAERDTVLQFGVMVRMEKALAPLIGPAAERGLKYMVFGLESACPRVLEKMNKGLDLDVANTLSDTCAEHDVCVEYYVIFGFPGETPDEAQQTYDYLLARADKTWVISASPWYLDPGSAICANPEAFGVEPIAGRELGWDPTAFRLKEGIDFAQANEYVARLKGDPILSLLVRSNGREDYWAILEVLRGDAADASA